MVTRNGWLTGGGALLLLAVGRLTGSFELFLLGAGVAVLLLVAVLRTALARLDLRVSRHVEPSRVHAGSPARVELRLRNDGSRSTPVLRLRDAVTGTRGATVLVSPLPSGGSGRAAYLLPTGRRGKLQVGPLDVIVGDAFGLTAAEVEGAGVTELIVYPRIDPIVALPAASGHDPQATARHPNAIGRAGDDFYALRPYQVGDDLRRVHGPATAHHDELMIRQHELPWQERTTVVLDVRSRAHVAESFELAVSAAASILDACANRGDQVRLITTAGSDSGFDGGRHHLEACFLHLATVEPDQSASLQRSLDRLGRGTSGGSLVLIVAALASTDLRRLSNLGSRFGKVVTVLIEPSSWDPDGIDQAAPPDVSNLVQVARDQSFLDGWNRLFGPGRAGGGPTTRATVGS
ncbi:MAG TPA: DUF58 domain-containing protein [Gaiellales bacterium]|nr:DUF58 domain-containing protein [Gaiellales bacterium]